MAWTERYVSIAGGGAHDGTTEADAWTLAEAIAAVAAGNRVNVIAGTYANTTTSRTFATAGTTLLPIWWRGYNATIGDIDANNALTKPLITFTTGAFAISGIQQIFSYLSIVGTANTASLVSVSAGATKFHRCRFDSQNAHASARAANSVTVSANTFSECHFKATSTANEVVLSSVVTSFIGCAFEGGGNAISSSSNLTVLVCSFNNNGADAIRQTAAASVVVFGCTFYSPGSDGIEFTVVPGVGNTGIVASNIFSECGGYGVINSSGANTNNMFRSHNLFQGNTSGTETGFGDSPSITEQTDISSPFTDAAGGDLSVLSTSNAKANGVPGGFENQSYTSYLDIGAVQRQESASGGGGGKILRSSIIEGLGVL